MSKKAIKNIICVMAFMAANALFGMQAVSAEGVSAGSASAEEGLARSVSVESVPVKCVSENTIAQEEITAEGSSILYSGKSGDLDWSIDSDGLLLIKGTGDYAFDYSYNNTYYTDCPGWIEYHDEIVKAKVEVTGITKTDYMFGGCENLINIDFSEFSTDSVETMLFMFSECSSLENLDLSGFNTSNVTSFMDMFFRCSKLKELDLSGFNTGNATDMGGMFSECSNLSNLNITGFDTEKVTTMSGMFMDCDELNYLDINGLDTKNVTDMSAMFRDCDNLTSIKMASLDTSKVTSMRLMFSGCIRLTDLDITNIDTGNVTDMSLMFDNCSSLESIDVSGFDTGNVTEMWHMFGDCYSLHSLDISGFDTGNVTNMANMFQNCYLLSSLKINGWNTNKVTDMGGMFYNCSSIKELNLESFDLSNVTNASGMLGDMSALIAIKTPYNIKTDISLPEKVNAYWVDENWVQCSEMKKGLSESGALTAIVDESKYSPWLNVDGDAVTINEDEESVYFKPTVSGAYRLRFLNRSTYVRVDYYEFRVDTPSYSGGIHYDEVDFQAYDLDREFNFYAEKNKVYRLTFSTYDGFQSFAVCIQSGEKAGKTDTGLIYKIDDQWTDEPEIEIIRYDGDETEVVVPSTIAGISVKRIGDYAFQGADIVSLTLEEGIESTMNYPFSYCKNLQTVKLPSTFSLSQNAFEGCEKLKEIIVSPSSDKLFVKDNMLYNNRGLLVCYFGGKKKTITIPSFIREIEPYALGDTGVEILYLPYSITSVWQSPRSLKEMHFRNPNVVDVYAGFPSEYDSETDKEVYKVKVFAPAGGTLESYCVEKEIPFFTEEYDTILVTFKNFEQYEEYIFELEKGEKIGKSIGLDNYIEDEDELYTFEGWYTDDEEKIYDPDDFKELTFTKDMVFLSKWNRDTNYDEGDDEDQNDESDHVNTSDIPETNNKNNTNDVSNTDKKSTSDSVPGGSKKAEVGVILHSDQVTSKEIVPANSSFMVTDANHHICSFDGVADENAAPVEIPRSIIYNGVEYKVTTVSPQAFSKQAENSKFKVTDNRIDSLEVSYTGAVSAKKMKKTVSIPEYSNYKGIRFRVTSVAAKSFKGNKKVTTIKIANTITSIEASCFEGCKKLQTITMGKGITTIGKNAFKNCKKLKTITIKSSKLKKVGKAALKGVNSKCRIKAPKKKQKAYSKLFKGKGQAKSVKVVKA